MYVVRMIEAVKSLCDALRCVLIELDSTGIFNDEIWKRITKPAPDALPPLHRLHRKRRKEHEIARTSERAKLRLHGNSELLVGRLENMRSRTSLKFLRRVDCFELWINELGRTGTACRWPDRDRWPYKE
jgi:hypothetical protein